MIIHAVRNIAKGEEISIQYTRNNGDFPQFRDRTQRSWKFQCTCSVCTAEAKSTEAKQKARAALVQEADSFFRREAKWVQHPKGPPSELLAKAEDIYARLEASYEPAAFHNVARLGLNGLGLWIARSHLTQRKYGKAIDKAIAALRNHGYFVKAQRDGVTIGRSHCVAEREVLDLALYACNAYLQRKDVKALALQKFAQEMYKTLYGSMRDSEKRYPGLNSFTDM